MISSSLPNYELKVINNLQKHIRKKDIEQIIDCIKLYKYELLFNDLYIPYEYSLYNIVCIMEKDIQKISKEKILLRKVLLKNFYLRFYNETIESVKTFYLKFV